MRTKQEREKKTKTTVYEMAEMGLGESWKVAAVDGRKGAVHSHS